MAIVRKGKLQFAHCMKDLCNDCLYFKAMMQNKQEGRRWKWLPVMNLSFEISTYTTHQHAMECIGVVTNIALKLGLSSFFL